MKRKSRKLACAAVAVLMTMCLAPAQALAATAVNVEGIDYAAAANGSGSGGGTWVWDGADAMALNNYNGGAIRATGDLTINLTGDNTVSNTGGSTVAVKSGDLTITGDGSLTATTTATIDRTGTIFADGGDVNITDTTVVVETTTGSGAYGVAAFQGDVNITGSDVSVTSTSTGAASNFVWNGGIMADCYGSSTTGGNVHITDSTVDVVATGAPRLNFGIVASNENGTASPQLVITNSNVAASGPTGAMASFGWVENLAGTITLTGSTITSPAGATVRDVSDLNVLNFQTAFYGQTIGTGSGPITYIVDESGNANPAIVKSATITAPKPESVPAPAKPTATVASYTIAETPKTGDDMALWMLADGALAAASGVVIVLAVRRKGELR